MVDSMFNAEYVYVEAKRIDMTQIVTVKLEILFNSIHESIIAQIEAVPDRKNYYTMLQFFEKCPVQKVFSASLG